MTITPKRQHALNLDPYALAPATPACLPNDDRGGLPGGGCPDAKEVTSPLGQTEMDRWVEKLDREEMSLKLIVSALPADEWSDKLRLPLCRLATAPPAVDAGTEDVPPEAHV